MSGHGSRSLNAVLAISAMLAVPLVAYQQQPAAPPAPNTYASTYQVPPSRPTVIRNAMILTAAGPVIERGAILLVAGKVAAVGATVQAPADALVIDAQGKWVTPG